jgi:hypothetical protein
MKSGVPKGVVDSSGAAITAPAGNPLASSKSAQKM